MSYSLDIAGFIASLASTDKAAWVPQNLAFFEVPARFLPIPLFVYVSIPERRRSIYSQEVSIVMRHTLHYCIKNVTLNCAEIHYIAHKFRYLPQKDTKASLIVVKKIRSGGGKPLSRNAHLVMICCKHSIYPCFTYSGK